MKYFFVVLVLILTTNSFSQQVVDVEKQDVRVSAGMFYVVGGSPVSTTKYVRVVEGSPYFSDDWIKGTVEIANGTQYQNIKLKLDLVDHSLLFLDSNNNEMIATATIKSVTLFDHLYDKKYEFIFSSFINTTGTIEKGWCQVLSTGLVTLYKQVTKRINEVKPYGSATVEQRISSINKYFLIANSTITTVKKIKDIPDRLTDKKDDLNKYINSMKLSGKNDSDYADLITYYNQIAGQ